MKPYVICHMMAPLDGRVVVENWSNGPDADYEERVAIYGEAQQPFASNVFICGRVTLQPFARGKARRPLPTDKAARPTYFAKRDAGGFAVILDPSGKLHWQSDEIWGSHLVMVLSEEVSDSHLCELAERGISYIVAGKNRNINLVRLLDVLSRELKAERILVEGGGVINGRFLAAGLIDEISVVIYPAIDGTSGTRTIFEGGKAGLADRVRLTFKSCEPMRGGAVHLRYTVATARG